ncbi:HlyD family efflux transporter periplasmic adaptor subunit [Rhodobacteraceae bacterium NNCM2]|nr:HlyD family efflux transporter periplasmic adaptor subunit [Coraliihabitans acroporae]
MSRIGRIEPSGKAIAQTRRGAAVSDDGTGQTAPFQRLAALKGALGGGEGAGGDAGKEVTAITAELLDADACCLMVVRDDALVLQALALDQRLASVQSAMIAELRLVGMSARRDGSGVAVPCQSVPGRVAIATCLPDNSAILLALLPGDAKQIARARGILELAVITVAAAEGQRANNLISGYERLLGHLAQGAEERNMAKRLRLLFDASRAFVTDRNGVAEQMSPVSEFSKTSPAGVAIRDLVRRRNAADAPIVETRADLGEGSLPDLLGADRVVALALADDATDRRSFALLIDPSGPFRTVDGDGWKVLEGALQSAPVSRPARGKARLGSARRFLPWVVAIAAVVGVMFIPVPDRIRASATLEPEGLRFVTAGFAAILKSADAAPGDTVVEGQVLGSLEGEALSLARNAALARASDAARLRDAAIRDKRVTDAELMRLEQAAAEAELDLLDWRLTQLQLRAPISGVVLSNAFERSEGAPVREGDVILEIAPLDKLRVRVDVPVVDLARLPEDATGTLFVDGSEAAGEIEITALEPAMRAVVRDGQTVLPLEATITNPDGALKPGQRGIAILPSGQAMIGEILFRRAWIKLMRWWR